MPSSGSSSTPVAVDEKRPLGAQRWSTSASFGAAASSPTPIELRGVAPAGLVSGPTRLNAVRTPISRRVGPAWRIAGWKRARTGTRSRARATRRRAESASWSMRTPSASSTSAEPDFEVIARLPCLATGTPAAATTSADVVEMLNVPRRRRRYRRRRSCPRAPPPARPARASPWRSPPARRPSRRASAGPSAGPPAGTGSPRRP